MRTKSVTLLICHNHVLVNIYRFDCNFHNLCPNCFDSEITRQSLVFRYSHILVTSVADMCWASAIGKKNCNAVFFMVYPPVSLKTWICKLIGQQRYHYLNPVVLIISICKHDLSLSFFQSMSWQDLNDNEILQISRVMVDKKIVNRVQILCFLCFFIKLAKKSTRKHQKSIL